MYDTNYTLDQTRMYLGEWGPKVALALALIVLAYFLGKALKWALAKGIDRIPGARHANQGAERRETVGARLGDVGFWLVLLIGVIAALNVLNLSGVVTPLNTMMVEFSAFVPNLVGAVVLFFLGYILATIARRLVVAALEAANLDSWLERAGLRQLTGASGIAKALGTLVFVLIVIPFAIAALELLQIDAISRPAVAVLGTVLDAIPRVLAAAVVLAIAFVIARWVSSLIEQLLPSFGFDNSIRAMTSFSSAPAAPPAPPAQAERYDTATSDQTWDGATSPTGDPGVGAAAGAPAGSTSAAPAISVTPSKVIANLAFAAIMIFAAVEAARLLNFAAIAEILEQILTLGGQVIFGGVIIAAGVIIANLLSAAIDRSTNNADGFASDIVKWATIALAVAMGLRFMGIADDIVTLAFGLILGSAAVAAALAFGIGGREQAARWLERWSNKADRS